jgi:hypothetical protein
MIDEDSLLKRKARMPPHLDEGRRHELAAAEAKAAGHGGIAAVARVAASAIGRGPKDLEAPETPPRGRIHRPGGRPKSPAGRR